MRVFLAAHGPRLAAVRVEQPRLLIHRPAGFPDFDLPQRLHLDRLHDKPHGVDVLDLAARAIRLPMLAHGHIHVRAHGPFFHIAITRAEVAQDRTQFAYIRTRFLRGADVRLADNFHQRHTGTVEVDIRLRRVLVVQRLSRILLQMQPRDADIFARAIRQFDRHYPGANNWVLELGNLIAGWQIRIEIILPVEPANQVDLRIQAQPGAHRLRHAFGINHRQHTGEGRINETHLRIRCRPECRRRARK